MTFSVASASTIMIATSALSRLPATTMRPATTMSNTAFSSCSTVGKATHWPALLSSDVMSATRTPPTGPENGSPAICVDADAALIATTSYRSFGFEAQNRDDDLDLVAQTVDEGRAQRPVDQAAGEDRVGGGTALTTEERARDAPGGVHTLFDVHRQREEVEVLLGVLRRAGGRQQHGLVVEVGDDGAGGLLSKATGLETDRAGAVGTVVECRRRLRRRLRRSRLRNCLSSLYLLFPLRLRRTRAGSTAPLAVAAHRFTEAVVDRNPPAGASLTDTVPGPESHYRGPTPSVHTVHRRRRCGVPAIPAQTPIANGAQCSGCPVGCRRRSADADRVASRLRQRRRPRRSMSER